jgi:hypothetical protein
LALSARLQRRERQSRFIKGATGAVHQQVLPRPPSTRSIILGGREEDHMYVAGNPLAVASELARLPRQEVVREEWDVFPAFARRQQVNG